MGLGFKYYGYCRQLVLPGNINKLAQNRLMTQMNTIEGTNGRHAALVPGAQVMQPANKCPRWRAVW